MKKSLFCVLLLAFSLSFVACQQGSDVEPPKVADTMQVQSDVTEADTVAVCDTTPVVEPQQVEQPKPVVVRKKPQPRKSEPKTVYVESYDAKGLVWGHVVLDGDSGTGTIHDSGENTYSVSCTRHGNELFAVDQNGRRYVFALRD